MLTLTNSFHNTQYRTRYTEDDLAEIEHDLFSGTPGTPKHRRARRARNRIWEALCGQADCTCDDTFGRR